MDTCRSVRFVAIVTLIVACIVACFLSIHRDRPPAQGKTVDTGDKNKMGGKKKLREDVLAANSSKQARLAFKAFFDDMTRIELEEARQDSNISIALQAAWINAQKPSRKRGNPRLQRFLGFLEGRSSVRIPRWWEVLLVGNYFNEQPGVPHPWNDYVDDSPFLVKVPGGICPWLYKQKESKDVGIGLSSPDNVSFARSGDAIILTVESFVCKIPAESFLEVKDKQRFDSCLVHFDSTHCFVLLYGVTSPGSVLLRLDPRSGQITWHQTVWGHYNRHEELLFGPRMHEAELVAESKVIVVFGCNLMTDFYVEAFDCDSGYPLFRFFPMDLSALNP